MALGDEGAGRLVIVVAAGDTYGKVKLPINSWAAGPVKRPEKLFAPFSVLSNLPKRSCSLSSKRCS